MTWERDSITELLLEAGRVALGHKRNLQRELKGDRSIVTQADREIEALLSRALEDPGKGAFIVGEETVSEKGEEYIQRALRETCYVIDPIDGTSPYAHGLPNWGVSIGLLEGGRLTQGAVYLPEYGEMVLSDEAGVRQGTQEVGSVGPDRAWRWEPLPEPRCSFADSDLIAITQAVAKRGRVTLRNPVQSLGAAVVPLVGLLQGRFRAYLGSVKLWDAAGALAMILRYPQFVTTVVEGEEVREVGAEVSSHAYHLEPGSPRRWGYRSNLQICYREEAARMRAAFFDEVPRVG